MEKTVKGVILETRDYGGSIGRRLHEGDAVELPLSLARQLEAQRLFKPDLSSSNQGQKVKRKSALEMDKED